MLNTKRVERDKLFFTADLHDMHDKAIHLDERPFDDVNDMHHALITNWNKVVSKNDTVVIVGDLAFNLKDAERFLRETNGYKYIVLGNHDKWYKGKLKCDRVLGVSDIINVNTESETIVCCHYPLESWEKMYYGTMHVHGHMHKYPNIINDKKNRYNCGCMLWDYKPVKIQEMIDKLGYNPNEYDDIRKDT